MADKSDEFIKVTSRGDGKCDHVVWTCPLGCGFTIDFLAHCGAADPVKPVRQITRHLIHGGIVHGRKPPSC